VDRNKIKNLNRVLGRLGNDIVGLITMARGISDDYQSLLDVLSTLFGEGLSEDVGMSDRLIAVVKDRDGNIKQVYDSGWSRNGITNAGFAQVAGLIIGVVTTPFTYIAIGTGTTAFDPTQTALVTEVKRKAATVSRVTTSVTNDTAQLQATFSSADGLTGTAAITESGVFDASTGGNMLCRQTFSALNINWDAGDTLTITWKLQVKQAT